MKNKCRRVENIENEKLLVTSNFSFSHIVFHSYVSFVHQSAVLFGVMGYLYLIITSSNDPEKEA